MTMTTLLAPVAALPRRIALSALTAALLLPAMAHAEMPPSSTETVLYTFSGGADGAEPHGGLIADGSGNLYGTTLRGGNVKDCLGIGCGVVFMLSPPGAGQTAWTYSLLHSFTGSADGAIPMAGLTMGPDGILYGTTQKGGGKGCGGFGCGTVFQLTPPGKGGGSWSLATVHNFASTDGAFPEAELTPDSAGNLFGTTRSGGTAGFGTVFRLAPTGGGGWRIATLYNFTGGADGGQVSGAVSIGSGGVLFGGAAYGGATGAGVIYQLMPASHGHEGYTQSVIYDLPGGPAGGYPRTGLVMDTAGTLYGTATNVAFALTPLAGGVWQPTILHSFLSFNDGNIPFAALAEQGIGGHPAFYGTTGFGATARSGVVYRLTPPGAGQTDWNETILYAFSGGADGGNPYGGVVPGAGGTLFGATTFGGNLTQCDIGCGVVFSLQP